MLRGPLRRWRLGKERFHTQSHPHHTDRNGTVPNRARGKTKRSRYRTCTCRPQLTLSIFGPPPIPHKPSCSSFKAGYILCFYFLLYIIQVCFLFCDSEQNSRAKRHTKDLWHYSTSTIILTVTCSLETLELRYRAKIRTVSLEDNPPWI